MTTAAGIGHGSTFSIGVTAIAEVLSISGPSLTRETVDATSMDSATRHREFISGLRDAGEVSLELNYTEAGFTALKAEYDDDTAGAYTIDLANGDTFAFSGFLTELTSEHPLDDKVTISATFKITGAVTYTGAA